MPDLQSFVTINGHRLRVALEGSGSPTVIFASGLGDDLRVWSRVRAELGQGVRSCTYDRTGVGESESTSVQKTAASAVKDLAALPGFISAGRPSVFVGHSIGGLLVATLATLHPELVAGIVLVDASHPAQDDRFRAAFSDTQWATYEQFGGGEPLERTEVVAWASRHMGPFPDVPASVIYATRQALPPDWGDRTGFDSVWLTCQEEYGRLLPGARRVRTSGGHYIHVEEPALVASEITRVLAAVRYQIRATTHSGSRAATSM